jgi:expansin (peptidoglycan-binding protein)
MLQLSNNFVYTNDAALDLSPSAFSKIGAKSKGVLNVKWHYEKAGWSP